MARLLVPFAFGLVLLAPPVFYIEALGRHGAELVVHGRDVGRGSAVAGTITAAGASGDQTSWTAQLRTLALHDQGVLSDAHYQAAKQRLLEQK